MKIGLVGLGRMGSAIAQRLGEQGFEIVAWDHAEKPRKAAAERGLRLAPDPKAIAAEAEIVISIITEDNGVRKIFTGENGMLTTEVEGKLFIEMSTLQPMTGRELAPLVEAKGARLIEFAGARHHPERARRQAVRAGGRASRGHRTGAHSARQADAPHCTYGTERQRLRHEAGSQSRARRVHSGAVGIARARDRAGTVARPDARCARRRHRPRPDGCRARFRCCSAARPT